MYIELFLLDNLLMDLLILRLASAMLSLRTSFGRMLLASFLGACFSAVGVGLLPMLLSPPAKLISGLLFALALPFRGFRGYLRAVVVLFLSALTVGGAVLAAAMAGGGAVDGGVIRCGISLRVALLGAAAASFLPAAIRRILARRVRSDALVRLTARIRGRNIECAALVDTGCTLTEPLTGHPVILLNGRKYPSAARYAKIPIPMRTANGRSIVYALKPELLLINGMRVEAYIAFGDVEVPLVPPMLAFGCAGDANGSNADYDVNNDERTATYNAEANKGASGKAARQTERRKRCLLHKFRRIPAPAPAEGAGSGADETTGDG